MPRAHLMGMKPTLAARSHRRLVALVAAGVVLLLLAGIGVYGLTTSPRPPVPDGGRGEPVSVATTPAPPAPTTPRLPTVAPSPDPKTFAVNVAEALFTWDTATGFLPLDYASMILTVGDPTGDEQAGLAADVAAYLPNRDAWIKLRQHATTQRLTVTNTYLPDAWATAVEQAQPGQLAPGTTAITIEGTRHRAGTWNGEPVASHHRVAFTVFVVCAPSYPTCRLLRLSRLDNPLR